MAAGGGLPGVNLHTNLTELDTLLADLNSAQYISNRWDYIYNLHTNLTELDTLADLNSAHCTVHQ